MPPAYLVTCSIPETGADKATAIREQIVSAKNQAAALAHVAADTIVVEKLSTEDAVRLGAAGVEIEQA